MNTTYWLYEVQRSYGFQDRAFVQEGDARAYAARDGKGHVAFRVVEVAPAPAGAELCWLVVRAGVPFAVRTIQKDATELADFLNADRQQAGCEVVGVKCVEPAPADVQPLAGPFEPSAVDRREWMPGLVEGSRLGGHDVEGAIGGGGSVDE
jgi:hypothetical protein